MQVQDASAPDRRGETRRVTTGRLYALGLVTWTFLEQLAFGAAGFALGLVAAAIQAGFLLTLLCQPWGRAAMRVKLQQLVAVLLFLGVLGVAGASFTRLGSEANAPIWAAVGATPSASIDRQATAIEMIKLTGLALVFVAAFACGRDRNRTWLVLRSITILGAAFCLLSLALHFLSPGLLFGYVITTGPDRLASTLGSANVAGTLFGLLLLCAAAALSQHWSEVGRRSHLLTRQIDLFLRRAPLEVASFALSASCLVLTASRTALAATAVSLLLFLCWEALASGLRSKRWFVPLIVALALAGVIGLGGDLVANRYLQTAADTASRVTIFQTHWHGFGSSQWMGSGLGSFGDLNRMLTNRTNAPDLIRIGAAHNVYLQWLEQAGLVGSILMWSCLAWLLGIVAVALFRKRSLSVVFRLSLTSSVLVLAHGLTDFSLEVPSVAAFWTLLLGLSVGRAS